MFKKFSNNYAEEEVNEPNGLNSLNYLRSMEVIDIKEGKRLGYIKDFVLDIEESKIVALLIPAPSRGWFSNEEDIEIPWSSVTKTGVDVIIVDTSRGNV